MNFGQATQELQAGKKVSRKGWNGKGMFLVHVNIWSVYGISAELVLRSGLNPIEYLPFIAMKTADDKLVPWLASQTDVLAEDWGVVE